MIAAETYLHLLSDPSHWLFELTVEGVTAVVAFIPLKRAAQWLLHRHDRDVHHVEQETA